MFTLSDQQNEAVVKIKHWFKYETSKPYFYLAGFAGTGKTTIAKYIAEALGVDVAFGSYTGKAAMVLRNKGCKGASTIHGLVYRPIEYEDGRVEFILNSSESKLNDVELLIIDECSMVNDELAADMLSFGVPILVLGDPFQLPPVNGEGYFTRGKPDFTLTEIHRQARENPIIALSMLARAGKKIPFGKFGNSRVITSDDFDHNDVLSVDQVLCGKNDTRKWTNNRIRELRGYVGKFPVLGEKLICLQNKKKKGFLNGSLWEVSSIKKTYANSIRLAVKGIDPGAAPSIMEAYVHESEFTGEPVNMDWQEKKKYEPFTFGYCLTVHKSQGSQWDNILLFDESSVFREDRNRWLYTAITRAAEQITIVS